MTVDEFVEKFTIEPIDDITPNFKLDKIINIDAHTVRGCFNCGNESNYEWLKSSSWTSVQHCFSCDHLNVVHSSDRMAGNYTDVVECFSDKL